MGKDRRSNGTDLEVSERIERGKAGRAVVVAEGTGKMVLLEAAMCGPSVEEGLHESPKHPEAESSAMGIDL